MYHHHTKTASMCQSVPVFQCARFNPPTVTLRNRLAGLREHARTICTFVENPFNGYKSIKNRPCTVLYAICPISTTRNRNTLLWYSGYNLPKYWTTFSSHNLTTKFQTQLAKIIPQTDHRLVTQPSQI